jgi:tetratricopeptide (TPR) repeat protein
MKHNIVIISSLCFGLAGTFVILAYASQKPVIQTASSAVSALPASPSQLEYHHLIWQESNEYRLKAVSAYEKGDYKTAEELCLKAIKAAPLTSDGSKHRTDYGMVSILARVYIRQNRNSEALKLYEAAAKDTPSLHDMTNGDFLDQALASIRLGKYDQALALYRKGIVHGGYKAGSDPLSADAPGTDTPQNLEASILLVRGEDVSYTGDRLQSRLDLTRAHELAPVNPIIADRLAHDLSYSDEKEKAEKLKLLKIVIKNSHDENKVKFAKIDLARYFNIK